LKHCIHINGCSLQKPQNIVTCFVSHLAISLPSRAALSISAGTWMVIWWWFCLSFPHVLTRNLTQHVHVL